MKHVDDQDLLLLSHRALGVGKGLAAAIHLKRCAQCRARYASYAALSEAVAFATRPGMAMWKPYGPSLWVKLLSVAALVAVIVGSGGVVVASLMPPRVPAPTAAANDGVLICKPHSEAKSPPRPNHPKW